MTDSKRILSIDGLRGIAVFIVLLFHFINNQYQAMDINKLNLFEKALMHGTYFGWVGVDLFFVLSGFLIGSILLKNKQSGNYFKVFYIRRFVRIIPVYYLLLFVFIISRQTSWYDASAYIFEKEIPLIYYFLFVQNFVMSFLGHFGPEALTPTWSLAIEEQFYLIIPWVVFFLNPRQLFLFIIFCLITGPISRYYSVDFYQKYTLLSSRIDSPAMGLLVAFLMSERKFFFKKYISDNIPMLKRILFFLIITSVLIYAVSGPGIFNHTIIAFGFALILLIALHDEGRIRQFLSHPFLLQLGGLSYFIYLFHQFINGALHLIILNHKIPVLSGWSSFFVSGLALVIVFLLAKISYLFFESPLIKLSHRLKY